METQQQFLHITQSFQKINSSNEFEKSALHLTHAIKRKWNFIVTDKKSARIV